MPESLVAAALGGGPAVVVGCSAGGLRALGLLLQGLRPSLPAPLLIVCHTASEEVELMTQLLARHSALPVQEARERTAPQAGVAYIAPSGYHLLVEPGGALALSVDAKVCYSRPAIDLLFASAADCWRERLIGVVLTGANDDGARGLRAVRRRGGIAIVQTPDDAEAPAMPAAALALAGADHVVPLNAVAPLINRLCQP